MQKISSRKNNWREYLGTFQIHTKDGKEKFLLELAKYWQIYHPAEADFFKRHLKRLQQVTKPGAIYSTGPDRDMYVALRLPQRLIRKIWQWDPDFGKHSDDIKLLARVWCDLVKPTVKDNRRRTRLYISPEFRRHVQQSSSKSKA